MTLFQLFNELEKLGVTLHLDGENLKINAPKGVLTPGLICELKENKGEILRFLEKQLANQRTPATMLELAEEKEYYPLSSAQLRLFFLQELEPASTGYNMVNLVKIEGRLDKSRLAGALEKLTARHECLRSSFHLVGGQAYQRIHQGNKWEIDEYISAEPNAIITGLIKPFRLSEVPLFRVGLIEITDNSFKGANIPTFVLMLDIHHIISDGISMGIFLEELIKLYKGDTLASLRIRYRDYSQWQDKERNGIFLKKQADYWLKQYEGALPVLNLPADFSRPSSISFAGDTLTFIVGEVETAKLREQAINKQVTLHMMLLAIFYVLLSKISGDEDIVVGIPVAGRRHAELEKVIGMFVNTLAFRSRCPGNKTFYQFLYDVKMNSIAAFENQDYPFEELVEKTVVTRDAGRNPIFEVMFAMQDEVFHPIEVQGIKLRPYDEKGLTGTAKFDLTMQAADKGDHLSFIFEYSTRLFMGSTIHRFERYYKKIIATVIDCPGVTLTDIDIMPEEERKQILFRFNTTERECLREKTFHEQFIEQASGAPGRIAVVEPGEWPYKQEFSIDRDRWGGAVSYGELNIQSTKLAGVLKTMGAGPGKIISILLRASLDFIISMFAILKTGGTYLPIDSDYPAERINYILKDSNTHMLISRANYYERIDYAGKILDFAEINGDESQESDRGEIAVDPEVSLGEPAYVIYTSGSTGRPKGVLVGHRGIGSLKMYFRDKCKITADDRIAQFAGISFDASILEIIMALLNGASLYLLSREIKGNIDNFINYMNRCGQTIILLPPTYARHLGAGSLKTLRVLITGGSATDQELVSRWREQLEYVNAYGPTETTICSACWFTRENDEFERLSSIPIGKAIANTQVYILDKAKGLNGLQPIGVAGELCIGGDGLAMGYLNHPLITNEKFTFNPFSPFSRLYHTGDLARWMDDGNIQFLGRIDSQVKIRGFRIEPSEIEYQLKQQGNIRDAVVVDLTDKSGEAYLCAYLVSDWDIPSTDLRQQLAEQLPDYMIPAHFVRLDFIPLIPSGKVDRRALPEPVVTDGDSHGDSYIAPCNDIEEILAEIWAHSLGIPKSKIGVQHNFFHLGGHSLKAALLLSQVHKLLDIKIPLAEIFKNPTIRGLAEYMKNIKSINGETYTAIEVVEQKEYYPLSSGQKRLFILQQLNLQGIVYNMPAVMVLEGELDSARLETSLQEMIRRHDILRTSFCMVGGEPVQIIVEDVKFKLQYHRQEDNKTVDWVYGFILPFDLVNPPLLRVALLELEAKKQLLMIDMHHIISDGTSLDIFVRELLALYKGEELPGQKIQYKDYSQWQNAQISRGCWKEQEAFWLEIFREEIPILMLPLDFSRPPVQTFMGSTWLFEIGVTETRALKKIAQEKEMTLFMVLLAAYNIFLAKISGQEDIVIGTPTSGRNHADISGIIGMFVNTLVLRNQPDADIPVGEFLNNVKENTLKAFNNQDYQYEELVERVVDKRDMARNPLFDVMFSLQNIDFTALSIPGLGLTSFHFDRTISKFDLSLYVAEVGEGLSLSFEYNTSLFKQETIERFEEFLLRVISSIIVDSSQEISQIEIITETGKDCLLNRLNDTACDFPGDKTLHRLFEEQVEKIPDNTALVWTLALSDAFSDVYLTYRELNKRADHLANLLREMGTGPDMIIPLVVERSAEMVLGIMSILKAGAAYLPIDPNYPKERIRFMLADSSVKIVLTQSKWANSCCILNTATDILYLDALPSSWQTGGPAAPGVSSSNLAYLIYTSGSTGMPKGVMVEHRSVVNRLKWMQKCYPINHSDTLLQKTPITFDVSVWELFWWASEGACLCLLVPGGEKEPAVISASVQKHGVTRVHFVPSMLSAFLEYIDLYGDAGELSSLRRVFASGETLTSALVRRFKDILYSRYSIGLTNLYGPTEATVDVSYFDCFSEEIRSSIPIGKPIDNIRLLVIGKNGGLSPVGIAGELCIAGVGLARGYLNRPELTAEKFDRGFGDYTFFPTQLDNERKDVSNTPGLPEPLYRTGDLARWLPDGNIEFLGRQDFQVKIRGIRIELGEIEQRIADFEGINDVVVTINNGSGSLNGEDENYICAYIVSRKEFHSLTKELRQYLSGYLPEYMIPTYFVSMNAIPFTCSGKIDRKALPLPQIGSLIEEYTAPQDPVQLKLVELWAEVLDIDKDIIGIDTNFFRIKGHSLKAVALIAKISYLFQVKYPLHEFFKKPTVRTMAIYIKQAAKTVFKPIQPAEKKEYYPLSPAQKRLYILNRMDEKSTSYNMPSIFMLEGLIDRERLVNICHQLLLRHESLRTSFLMLGEEPVQILNEPAHVTLPVRYGDVPVEPVHENLSGIIEDFVHPFVLSQAPLLHLEFIKIEEVKHLFLIDMHHIIADGLSLGILLRDFMGLYEGSPLRELRLQYKDYSQWMNHPGQKEVFNEQENYWLAEYERAVPVLNLPIDFPRPAERHYQGGIVKFQLGAEEKGALKDLAQAKNVTMFILLLALQNILLAKLSGGSDIVVGTPTAGRRHVELQDIVGMFVNSLALRNFPGAGRTFNIFLQDVKERTLAALDNQEYPFEILVEKIGISRTPGSNPLFDVMFTMEETEVSAIKVSNLHMRPIACEIKTAKFDLTLQASETGSILSFVLEYSKELFKLSTIERFSQYYKRIANAVVQNPEQRIGDIELILPGEKEQILFQFNDTGTGTPGGKKLHDLFQDQVERTPDIVAVSEMVGFLSYAELNVQANRLAWTLIEKGVRPGVIVGIKANPSAETIAGMLGVLKAGGAYLPLDPLLPAQRILYMVRECRVSTILTDGLAEEIGIWETSLDIIHLAKPLPHCQKGYNPEVDVQSSHLAYVIFTSGTTGRPDGVMIEHRNIVSTISWFNSRYQINSESRVLQMTNISFDVSVEEIFSAITQGGVLLTTSRETLLDMHKLRFYIIKNRVNIMQMVPMLLREFLEIEGTIGCLKTIICGGDILDDSLKNRVLARGYRLHNHYGPTETAVDAVIGECGMEKISIGKPVPGVQAYIVDEDQYLQPIGVAGELCIGGASIARGYLGNPEKTCEKFIPLTNAIRSLPAGYLRTINASQPGNRVYYTGDMARWRENGSLEFIGRKDFQVKIRGQRVELSEIENRLLKHEDIREAVVVAHPSNTLETTDSHNPDPVLCAYIVTGNRVEPSLLREFLAGDLPHYMIPLYFVEMAKFPKTLNGKIDRRALPIPVNRDTHEMYTPPRNEMEKLLVELWVSVLKPQGEKIGIDSDFFQLGGHSLKATLLMAKIHEKFQCKVPLTDFFKTPTIRALSSYIHQSSAAEKFSTDKFAAIESAAKRDYYPLSSAQKRLFTLQIMDSTATTYNMPVIVQLEGKPDKQKIESSVNEIIQRHEILRTSFELIGEEIVQRIHSGVNFIVDYLETDASEAGIEKMIAAFIQPFQLDKLPLLRIRVTIGAGIYLLMLDMHHIICDGMSMEIFIKEFATFYEGKKLPRLQFQYKDYCQLQNSSRHKKVMDRQATYWLDELAENIPHLQLPTDYKRPSLLNFEGDSIEFYLEGDETHMLKRLAQDSQATLFMVLLAIYNILLAKIGGQDDIIVGTPVAGRNHAHLETLIGMFVNTLALRNFPTPGRSFSDFLNEVKTRALMAFENQDYQFEELVNRLVPQRPANRNPLFDVMLVLQNMETEVLDIEGLKMKNVNFKNRTAKFDLNFVAVETGDQLFFSAEYNTRLFRKETVWRFTEYFKEIVRAVLENKDIRLKDIRVSHRLEPIKPTIPTGDFNF